MIQAILFWCLTADAKPSDKVSTDYELTMDNFITYQKLSPKVQVAYLPSLNKKEYCAFALAVETNDGDVDLTDIKIAFDDKDLRHKIPLDQRHFPKTEGEYTFYPIVLGGNIAIIKTESYGKSGRVVISRSEQGECSFSQI
jgi:hypothetical protein